MLETWDGRAIVLREDRTGSIEFKEGLLARLASLERLQRCDWKEAKQ
jgi:hypothetical protein